MLADTAQYPDPMHLSEIITLVGANCSQASSNKEHEMSAIYPISFYRLAEKRWTQRPETLSGVRRSPTSGTDLCLCGNLLIAPTSSKLIEGKVINEWKCNRCQRAWETEANLSPFPSRKPS